MTSNLMGIVDMFESDGDRLTAIGLIINNLDSATSELFGSRVCIVSESTAVAVELPEVID